MTNAVIEARQLVYGLVEGSSHRDVLVELDLTIDKGQSVALLGASGSGKSTLLNLLGGIDRPTSGQISLGGQEITAMKEPALTLFRRQHIGYVYQLFNLIPTLTLAENIALPLELAGVSAKTRLAQTEHWLERVGLAQRAGAFPDQLSGGEQQRVAIARALIHQPDVVLADEPTGNLDADNGRKILDLLLSLAAENQQTLLVVTHSLEVASRCQRVLKLNAGQLTELAGQGASTLW